MKKICTFTQTYSNSRDELFIYHNLDTEDIRFRNLFNLNLYSFHNCSDEYREKILNNIYFKSIKNLEIVSYNNLSYTETWKKTLELLKMRGVDYIIFLQDDCFTKNKKDIEIDEIYNFIQENDFDMLNLECNFYELNCESNLIYSNDILNVYDTSSDDFSNNGWYSFDDGPYVAKLDFLIKNIYDDNYYLLDNIWVAESYLNQKIKENPVKRFTTNMAIYNRFNLIGPNNWNKIEEMKKLKDRLNYE